LPVILKTLKAIQIKIWTYPFPEGLFQSELLGEVSSETQYKNFVAFFSPVLE